MKLEYLEDLTEGGRYPNADPDKFIRLFSFDHEEVWKLIEIIQYWIVEKRDSVDISNLPFIQPVNCTLLFEVSPAGLGIDPSPDNRFVCRLPIERYRQMAGYLSAFESKEGALDGFNWLYDPPAEKIDLLFSARGAW